jgi:hypothetical protein
MEVKTRLGTRSSLNGSMLRKDWNILTSLGMEFVALEVAIVFGAVLGFHLLRRADGHINR